MLSNSYLGDDAVGWRVDGQGSLVGFDLSDSLVGFDRVADFFDPRDVALRDRVGKGRTFDDSREQFGRD